MFWVDFLQTFHLLWVEFIARFQFL